MASQSAAPTTPRLPESPTYGRDPSPEPDYRRERAGSDEERPSDRRERAGSERRSDRSGDMVTRTGVVHIPRWAAKFVLGGRSLKNFYNLCKRNGNLVAHTPVSEDHDWTTFKQPNGQIFAVLILIGYGEASRVEEAMRAVKSGLMTTLHKAKQMKTDGTWHDDRRDSRRRRDYRDDHVPQTDSRRDCRRNYRDDHVPQTDSRRDYRRDDRRDYRRDDRRDYRRRDDRRDFHR